MLSSIFPKPRIYYQLDTTVGCDLASILLIQCDDVSELNESFRLKTKAFDLFERTVNDSPFSAKDQFETAVTWAREAHRCDHQSAVHAYIKSLTLLGRRLVTIVTIRGLPTTQKSI